MNVEAVCFDLDDTLYDYHDYARAGLRSAADRLEEHAGGQFHEELEALYFEESITDGTFDHLLERQGLPAELADELVEAFHDATTPLDPYPETEPVLGGLAERFDLGLITDGRGGHAKLARLELAEYFETVLVTPTIDCTKAETTPFERALLELSVPPESAVYVGDDPRVDFRRPNELGMGTVRLRRGRYADLEPPDDIDRPDRELDSLAELGECLDADLPELADLGPDGSPIGDV